MGKRQAQLESVTRRNFLKLAGAGGGAAAVALAVETKPVTANERAGGKQQGTYVETEHVRAYYAAARM
jgi:hypothetical protein